MLEDYSRNGTIVNGEMIHQARLALHSQQPNIITMGALKFTIHVRVSPDERLLYE